MEGNPSSQATATTETTPNSTANRQPLSVSYPRITTLETINTTSSQTAIWLRNTPLSTVFITFTRHTEGTAITESMRLPVSDQQSAHLTSAMTRAFSNQSDNLPVPVGHSAVPFTFFTKDTSGYVKRTVNLHQPTEQSIALAKGIAMIYANRRLPPEEAPNVINAVINAFLGQPINWPVLTGQSANPSASATATANATSNSNANQSISTGTFSIEIIFIQAHLIHRSREVNQVGYFFDFIRDGDGNLIQSANSNQHVRSSRTTAGANSNQPSSTAFRRFIRRPTRASAMHITSAPIDLSPTTMNLIITLLHNERSENHLYDIFVLIGVKEHHIFGYMDTIIQTVDDLVDGEFGELLQKLKENIIEPFTFFQQMTYLLKDHFEKASLIFQNFCQFVETAKRTPNKQTTYVLLNISKQFINIVLDNIITPAYSNEFEKISKLKVDLRTGQMELVDFFIKLFDLERYKGMCYCKVTQKKLQTLHCFCHRLTQYKEFSTSTTPMPPEVLQASIHFETTVIPCRANDNRFYSVGLPNWSSKPKPEDEEDTIQSDLAQFLQNVKKLFNTRPQRYRDFANLLISYNAEYTRSATEARALLTSLVNDEPELRNAIDELFQSFTIRRDDQVEDLKMQGATFLYYLGPMIGCDYDLFPEKPVGKEKAKQKPKPIVWSSLVRQHLSELIGSQAQRSDLSNADDQIETMKCRMAAMQKELDYYRAKEEENRIRKKSKTREQTQSAPSTSGVCLKEEEETE